MAQTVFDRETVLDMLVNVVPLGIMIFFFVLFVVANPFRGSFFIELVSLALLVIPIVSLALLTYVAALKLSE